MSRHRVVVGLVALWLTVIGSLLGWTFAMHRLFLAGEAVIGAIVGVALPLAVALVSVLAWAVGSEEGS